MHSSTEECGRRAAATIFNPCGRDYAAIRSSYIELLTSSEAYKNLSDFAHCLLQCMIDNGLRVSEVTDTRRWRVMDNSVVMVWQHKTNSWRSATHCCERFGLSVQEFAYKLRQNCVPRFAIYRLFRAAGLIYHNHERKRDCVTHLFRRLLALSLWQQTSDLSVVQRALAHKSVASTISYLDEALRLAPRRKAASRRHDDEVSTYVKHKTISNLWQKEAPSSDI